MARRLWIDRGLCASENKHNKSDLQTCLFYLLFILFGRRTGNIEAENLNASNVREPFITQIPLYMFLLRLLVLK